MNAAAPLDAAAPLNSTAPLVGIAMGSASDLATLKPAADILERFGIEYDLRVLSAHRTPWAMAEYARTAASRGLKVLIAGAGGAAHLPGMLAAHTPLPVIGVPVPGPQLNGLDSLLSIVQMPRGVPVATVAVGGGANAGILAVQILACSDPALLQRVVDFKEELADLARQQDAEINRPHL